MNISSSHRVPINVKHTYMKRKKWLSLCDYSTAPITAATAYFFYIEANELSQRLTCSDIRLSNSNLYLYQNYKILKILKIIV